MIRYVREDLLKPRKGLVKVTETYKIKKRNFKIKGLEVYTVGKPPYTGVLIVEG